MVMIEPKHALMASAAALFFCLIALYISPGCESVYRPCPETCKRLNLKCGVSQNACTTACEDLDAESFVELTECVWSRPKCDDSLQCWPYEEGAPWDLDP